MIYFGITIGPIIETLDLTSSPAGLWCASYMFSDITYQICCELEKELGNDNLKIYSPYFPLNEVENKGRLERIKPNGVGSYHDRIIFSCGESEKEKSKKEERIKEERIKEERNEYRLYSCILDKIINGVKTKVARKIPVEFAQALEKYFSIQFLSVREEKGNTNIILTISEYLDALELNKPVSGEGKIQLKNFFDNERSDSQKNESDNSDNIEEQGKNKLIKESAYVQELIAQFENFSEKDSSKTQKNKLEEDSSETQKNMLEEDSSETQKNMFPLLKKTGGQFFIRNITEISTPGEFMEMNKRDEKNEKPKWYFALIQADGDNMGKLLQKVSNDKIEDFSERCMAFSVEAAQKIHEFGGVTIYAGGDDLLFITPIFKMRESTVEQGKKRKNILNLCGELDKLFRDKFETSFINTIPKDIAGDIKLSLSFGVTLCYNKEPLYEVLKNTQRLLFGEAKGIRNTKSIELRKHSGAKIAFNLVNKSKVEKKLLNLIAAKDSEDKVNSILYHLHEFEQLYNLAFMENSKGEKKIENFFKNMFDRHVEQEEQKNNRIVFKNKYVKAIYELAIAHWNENQSKYTAQNKEKDYSPARELAALLKFAKFFGEEGRVHE